MTSRQDDIVFEIFEVSAPAFKVTACQGASLREFPDRAATLQRCVITEAFAARQPPRPLSPRRRFYPNRKAQLIKRCVHAGVSNNGKK